MKSRFYILSMAMSSFLASYNINATTGDTQSGSSDTIENIILLAIVAVVAFAIYRSKQSKEDNVKRRKNPESTLDLLSYKEITKDGLIVMPDGEYRKVAKVIPCNQNSMSLEELSNAWVAYRNYIHSISTRQTNVVTSQLYDMKYYNMLVAQSIRQMEEEGLPEAFIAYHKNILKEHEERYVHSQKRVKEAYIVFKISEAEMLETEKSISFGSAGGILNSLTDSVATKNADEILGETDEAKQETVSEHLDDAMRIAHANLSEGGMYIQPLGKLEVLDYINKILNRDTATAMSVEDMNDAGVFNIFPQSITPHHLLIHEYEKMIAEDSEGKEVEIFYEDESIEDEDGELVG